MICVFSFSFFLKLEITKNNTKGFFMVKKTKKTWVGILETKKLRFFIDGPNNYNPSHDGL